MQRPTILVLEDMQIRVDWLRDAFPHATVVWLETVSDLMSSIAALGPFPPALILLDHDLGLGASHMEDDGSVLLLDDGVSFPLDVNGNNGMHAVDMMPDSMKVVPMIVWSINGPRAREMVARLTERGFVTTHIPFTGDRMWQLRSAIATQVC